MRILITAGEEECRNLLRDMFVDKPSIQLTLAHDGAEAWRLLNKLKQRFDLGILDLRMPNSSDCSDVGQRLRALRHP